MCAGGGCKLDFRLILASNWGHDTGRGSSQHLRTLERVPVNKKLLTGTVPVNNLFQNGIESGSLNLLVKSLNSLLKF